MVGKTRKLITGFESSFADAPTTPAEYAEEKKLYASDVPFPERIEQCIQRYRQKRRWNDSGRTMLFDKYLALGGIETSQRQFQGLDPKEAKELSKEDIRELTARNFIQYGRGSSKFYDPEDSEHWTVDFVTVVKGFLSRWVPENHPRSDRDANVDIQQAADLILNFMNYILMHDVCPEHNNQIIATKAICQVAPTELQNARLLFLELPDSFNTAAKFLFCDGGAYDTSKPSPIDDTAPETAITPQWEGQDVSKLPKKLDPFTQLVIFRITVMDTIKDEIIAKLAATDDPTQIRVKKTHTETYQVISVHRPKKSQRKHLEKLLAGENLQDKVKPAGTMVLRPTIIDHAYSNRPRPEEVDFSKEPTSSFIVDDDVLAKVQPGMKMELEVGELNIGVKFIKKVHDIRVSFDTLLPQSLMLSWKEPSVNDRPPPSVDNPDVENVADDEM